MKLARDLDVSPREFARANVFIVGILSFAAFGALLLASTSGYVAWGISNSPNNGAIAIGMGPFIAGASSDIPEVVWWSDLSSNNVCFGVDDESITLIWASPRRLCDQKRHFHIPGVMIAIQSTLILAYIFSCLAFIIAFSTKTLCTVRLLFAATLLGAILTTIQVFLWIFNPLVNGRVIVPLWGGYGKNTHLVTSNAVQMSFGWSFALIVAGLVLLVSSTCISYSIIRLPARLFESELDDEGSYGLYPGRTGG